MRIHFAPVFRFFFCRRKPLFLALCCFLGFAFGMMAAQRSGDSYFSMMRMALSSHVSIPGLIASVSLPFLLAAFAVYIRHHGLLYGLCFIKMFLFSFVLMGLRLTFGSAGWLLCGLLMLSNSISVTFLISLCFRNIRSFCPSVYWDIGKRLICVLAISLLDYQFIAPILAQIIAC